MGQHKLTDKPAWQRTERTLTGRLIHISKELIPVPVFALGVDGRETGAPVSFRYALAKAGNTYRRPTPKVRARKRNDWGADWAVKQRDRQEAGARQRAAFRQREGIAGA